MYHKSIKTHFDRNVFITFLVLFFGGLSLLSFRINDKEDCTGVDFEILTNSYTVEDLIEFKSIDKNGVDWSWDFGDGSTATNRSNVTHQFKTPGLYKVTLSVNGQCKQVREVAISKQRILIDPERIPTIQLPDNIRVGDEVVFSNNSPFAETWQWSFGETTRVDGTDQQERYVFKTPGEKTILLVVNNDRLHEAKQRITVLPKKRSRRQTTNEGVDPIELVLDDQIEDIPVKEVEEEEKRLEEEEANRIEVSSDEIRQMLVGYANRTVDDIAIRNYFCYSSIPVFNKGGSRKTVNQLFNTIRDVKIEFKDLKLVRDSKTGCIKSMTLDLRTKKGLFWKNF
ncbi:PKD domain-containing protein [Costertonia aggregata]|uniref:PKD domain-containing protein n=1 Tax=Costertonia aggregata TaxID=343403 RepID=A0A7H9AU64_9FLAO|nr:PKD domain-containing protein [Costertonia aggregata]QLG46852.1 PKD domain-containing protein [Costertonia aggregata]